MGVQIIGRGGVDKRIDVLATAMQFGSTVFDLEHLELGYAPPYGSAKDAVNMAGFVASNVLRGDCKIVQAEQLTREKLDKLQVVDVRSPEEFARGHLHQAVNLPLNDLRQQSGTWIGQDQLWYTVKLVTAAIWLTVFSDSSGLMSLIWTGASKQ
ncbi:hypothetical protein NW765_016795 [Fusarium oxysporum]|nr:hypothetical protein NW765_016795 [Fusarium oxysporum]